MYVDAIMDVATTMETIVFGGLLSSYSSAVDAEIIIHGVLTTVVAVITTIITTAAVPSSGSSYYPASVETEAFSKAYQPK